MMGGALRLLLVLAVLACSVSAVGNHASSRGLTSFTFKPPFFPDAGLAAVPGWEVKGSTVVDENYIRLTSAEPDVNGYIINRRPYFLSTVELTLAFRIHSDNPNYGADGLALWMTDQPLKSGDCMGVSCQWNGIAVFFDTYDNNGSGDNPRISVHHNDGSHDFQFHSDGRNTELIGCKVNYRNAPISYLHLFYEEGALNVFIDERGSGDWKRCGPAYEIAMPRRYFFGLSAATGGLYDNHDVISLDVSTMDAKKSEDMMKPEDVDAVDDIADYIRPIPQQDDGTQPRPDSVPAEPIILVDNKPINVGDAAQEQPPTNIGEQIPPEVAQKSTPPVDSESVTQLQELRQQLEQKSAFIQSQDQVLREIRSANNLQENQLIQKNAEILNLQNRLQQLEQQVKEIGQPQTGSPSPSPNAECDVVGQKDEVANIITAGLDNLSTKMLDSVQEAVGHKLYEAQFQLQEDINGVKESFQQELRGLREQIERQREIISKLTEQSTILDVGASKSKSKMEDKMDGFTISMAKMEKTMMEMASLSRETSNSLQHIQRYVSSLPPVGSGSASSRDYSTTIPGLRTALLIVALLIVVGVIFLLVYLIKQCKKPVRRYGSSLYQ